MRCTCKPLPSSFLHPQECRRTLVSFSLVVSLLAGLVAWCATRYTSLVIKSFKHKGLRRYFETGTKAGIQAKHATRLRLQLAALDTAQVVEDMEVPGYRLHPLKGRAKNRWSIWVSGNWRLTFEFRDGNAYILDYEDYH
jgi:proteic killer suppression protein